MERHAGRCRQPQPRRSQLATAAPIPSTVRCVNGPLIAASKQIAREGRGTTEKENDGRRKRFGDMGMVAGTQQVGVKKVKSFWQKYFITSDFYGFILPSTPLQPDRFLWVYPPFHLPPTRQVDPTWEVRDIAGQFLMNCFRLYIDNNAFLQPKSFWSVLFKELRPPAFCGMWKEKQMRGD